MWYINIATYFPGATSPEAKWFSKQMDNIVQIFQGRSSSSFEDFSSFWNLSFEALFDIALGEELLVHFVNKYEFHG